MKKVSAASLEKEYASRSLQSARTAAAAAKDARAAAYKQLVASVEPVSRAEATLIAMGVVAVG